MHKLLTVTRFALRDMLRSWILWVLAALLLLAIPISSVLLHRSSLWSVLTGAHPATALSATDKATYINGGVVLAVYAITLLCGGIITTNVALERTSKVSILVFRLVKPATMVWGKLLALAILVTGLLGAMVLELVALNSSGYLPLGKISALLGLQQLTLAQDLTGLLYALLGITLYTTLYAMIGLLVTNSAQLQFAQLPVTLILIISFTTVMASLTSPHTTLTHVLAYIPFTSPFIEAGRVITHDASTTERVGSLLALLACLILASHAMSSMVRTRTPHTHHYPTPLTRHHLALTH